jgi:hypothetical protein
MIELIVNGIHLPVKQAPLAFRFKSPILHKQDGSIIYSLQVSITPVSREVFGFTERLASKSFGSSQQLVGELKIQGLSLGSVMINLDGVSGDFYKLSAGVNRGFFNYQIADLNLRETLRPVHYNFPGGTLTLTQLIEAGYSQADILPFVIFPVKNTTAYENREGWPIPDITINALLFQNVYRLISSMEVVPTNPWTPFFKLAYIVDKLVETLGYRLTRNDLWSGLELSRLVVYSNNLQFIFDRYAGPINEFWRLGDFMPNMKVLEFLEAIETAFNAKLLPDSTTMDAKFVFVDEVFDPKGAKDLEVRAENIVEIDFQKKKQDYKFTINSPDDTIYAEFVQQLDNDNFTFKGLVDSEVALPSPSSARWGDIYQSVASGAYYVLSITDSDTLTWEFLTLDYIDFIIGNKEKAEEIRAQLSPVITAATDYYHGQLIDCPNVGVPAFGNIFRGPRADAGLRLMFYRGLMETLPAGYQIPFGSSDNRTLGGVPIPGAELAIRWQGQGGFLDKFWPKRLNWLKKNNLPVTCSKKMTMQELREWDWMQARSIDGRMLLPSIIEGEILPSGVINARLELFPL